MMHTVPHIAHTTPRLVRLLWRQSDRSCRMANVAIVPILIALSSIVTGHQA